MKAKLCSVAAVHRYSASPSIRQYFRLCKLGITTNEFTDTETKYFVNKELTPNFEWGYLGLKRCIYIELHCL